MLWTFQRLETYCMHFFHLRHRWPSNLVENRQPKSDLIQMFMMYITGICFGLIKVKWGGETGYLNLASKGLPRLFELVIAIRHWKIVCFFVQPACTHLTIRHYIGNLQLQNQNVPLTLSVLHTLHAFSRSVRILVSQLNVVSMLNVRPAITGLCVFAELVMLEIHTAFVKSVRQFPSQKVQ